MKWQTYINHSKVFSVVLILILVSSLSVRLNMDLTGFGRIAHTKTKEDFQVFSIEKYNNFKG